MEIKQAAIVQLNINIRSPECVDTPALCSASINFRDFFRGKGRANISSMEVGKCETVSVRPVAEKAPLLCLVTV